MAFRPALRPFKAMFQLKTSMSRVLPLLDFDHRQGIQFFRARQHGFPTRGGQTSSNRKKQNLMPYPKRKKAYAELVSDMRGDGNGRGTDFLIKPVIPETIIAMIKKRYEKKGRLIET